MKALILTINENILNGLEENNAGLFLLSLLFSKGVEIAANMVISSQEELLKTHFNNIADDINTVIILGDQDVSKNLKIKELIANYIDDKLAPNPFSKEAIKTYYKNLNLPLVQESLNEALIPTTAKSIESYNSYKQGFVVYQDGKHIIFLPNELVAVKEICDNWLTDYIEAKFSKLYLTKTLKTFGLTKNEALKLLNDLLKNKNQIKLLVYEHDLELIIVIKYSPLSPKEDINAFIKNVVERLKNFIYATGDVSLYETAFNLLKSTNTTLAIAESVTGGNIIANLIKNNEGISDYLVEGLTTYSNNSKELRLKVDLKIIDTYSSVSAETAYEMAAGLIETCEEARVVLATVGYASGKAEQNGLVFVALGDLNGIHIYKNKFSGTRQKIIELASKTALFYLIKKIKQNNINVEQMFDKD
jgi:nicotinamide-nucleotide amidase